LRQTLQAHRNDYSQSLERSFIMQVAISNELLVVLALALVLVLLLVFLIPAAGRKRHIDPTNDGEPLVEEYPDKQVQVTVPWQGYTVKVLRIPSPPLSEMPPIKVAEKYDWPHHVWLNVVVAREDNPDALVTQFAPRLKLRIGYSAEDQDRARAAGLEHPIFGFWDGCQWVLFTKEKHDLSYELPADNSNSHEPNASATEQVVGYAVVQLAAWSDPSIGGGP
jgi:hypothetical protein